MYLFIFQLALTLLMLVSINAFGSIRKGYVAISQLLATTNLGYNLLYRILSPTVFISFATLILYQIGLSRLSQNIWLISVYYFLLNFIILLITKKIALVNKFLYLMIVSFSISLAYFVYNNSLKYGASAILPESGNFRTELWFIIFAYFYSLLNDFSPNYAIEEKRKNKFLADLYKKCSCKYEDLLLREFINNKLLKSIFFSIMIIEDMNRPHFIRILEKMFFFTGFVKTTGIMQVRSKKLLSDKQSIIKAQKIILAFYNKHMDTTDEYLLVNKVAADYNGSNYGKNIMEIYPTLKDLVK